MWLLQVRLLDWHTVEEASCGFIRRVFRVDRDSSGLSGRGVSFYGRAGKEPPAIGRSDQQRSLPCD